MSSIAAEKIAVIGLGYVGHPVALAFAANGLDTTGFDIDAARIAELKAGADRTGQYSVAELQQIPLRVTATQADLQGATVFVITVPTPIDENRQPYLEPLRSACEIVGGVLKKGAVVIFESTVYPGLTEEICGPWLAARSGLEQGTDFKLGYSPERINPGDHTHTIDKIVKVVAGEDAATLDRVAALYQAIIPAGIHRAPSIRVAEAAKVLENTQRDVNIALMNELAVICDRLGIVTQDVLAAARTKWNFLPFTPGLVGGHCIGVDPYYLTAKAESVGHHPEVILAGRRINDGMGAFVAQKLLKLLARADHPLRRARVGILGLTFKEDVKDLRNSKVVDIVTELTSFGLNPLVHDALADPAAAQHEYGVTLSPLDAFTELHGLVIAVPHAAYKQLPMDRLRAMLRPDGVVIDVKGAFAGLAGKGLTYWSL